MPKKYIIELEDEVFTNKEGPDRSELHRAVGFNSLVFDDEGIRRLVPFDDEAERIRNAANDEGYRSGYDMGYKCCSKTFESDTDKDSMMYRMGVDKLWSVVRRIILPKDCGCSDSIINHTKDIFGDNTPGWKIRKIFMDWSPNKSESPKEPEVVIQIGDQVDIGDGNKGIVFAIDGDDIRGYFYPDQALQPVPFMIKKNVVKVTGNHVNGIEQLIDAMK